MSTPRIAECAQHVRVTKLAQVAHGDLDINPVCSQFRGSRDQTADLMAILDQPRQEPGTGLSWLRQSEGSPGRSLRPHLPGSIPGCRNQARVTPTQRRCLPPNV